jgi:signal transduction histidine kinase
MRTLRRRLFVAILGVVLLAVGVSLAVGIVLTRSAQRDTIRNDVTRQADAIAQRLRSFPTNTFPLRRSGSPPRSLPGILPAPPGAPGPAGLEPSEIPVPFPSLLDIQEAAQVLPPAAAADLRTGREAEGTLEQDGRRQLFAARRVGETVALVTRPDVLSGDDFQRYLTALLIAGGLAALFAAGLAALLARRVAAPLQRVSEASRVLAAGGSPEPIPRERTTELAAMADAFNEMARQLERAREAERSVLLSVSHELRTPLTSIRGYAEGIEDGTVAPREAAQVVGRESARLERLVGDLLALAKLRQGVLEVQHEPVDLGAVVREAEERLRPQAMAAGVEVGIEPDGTAAATADHDRTLQVVSNLLENAIRVTPKGGRVVLAATPGIVNVRDQGPGIPEQDLPRAFERFHLRRRHGRGSPDGAGLGLAIVRDLTEAMGGQGEVENVEGGGAGFTVRLRPG